MLFSRLFDNIRKIGYKTACNLLITTSVDNDGPLLFFKDKNVNVYERIEN